MPAHGKTSKATRTANENAVIEALAEGATYTEAANRAGVLPATVTRYAADPEIMHRVQHRRDTIAANTTAAVTAATIQAIDVLIGAMHSRTTTESVRVSAARAILSEARAWRDTEIGLRLAEIEDRLHTNQYVTSQVVR
jgi:hypothetical protein